MKKERSRRSPAIGLSESVRLAERIQTQIGASPASRESIAEAIGYSGVSGASAPKLAALGYFQLVVSDGAGARIGDVGRAILNPTSEQERAAALAEAVKAPTLYKELFERYGDGPLPGLLANLLVREFGILPGKGEDVATVFRESVEFAGLLRNGILHSEPSALASEEEDVAGTSALVEPPLTAAVVARPDADLQDDTGCREHVVPLRDGVATVRLPDPLIAADLARVRRWASLMEQLIDSEETPDDR